MQLLVVILNEYQRTIWVLLGCEQFWNLTKHPSYSRSKIVFSTAQAVFS